MSQSWQLSVVPWQASAQERAAGASAMKLTVKQELFCQEYRVDQKGQRSAVAAGYPPKNARIQAHKNLKKPHIQARLKELRIDPPPNPEQEAAKAEPAMLAANEKRTAINAEFVRQRFLKVIELALPPEERDRFGRLTSKAPKLGDATRALEALGRHIGFFEKDNMQQGQVGVPEVEKLSPEARLLLKEALIEYLGSPEGSAAVGGVANADNGERVTH